MKILCYGSLNIDYVYRVPHFVKPGETLSSASLERFAGGKGVNQSVALARAGGEVFHAGKIGSDGKWLKEKLKESGVHTEHIGEGTLNNGHAIIQVDDNGNNAIVLYAGANHEITEEEIDQTLGQFEAGDYLLLQNEINLTPSLIKKGHEAGLKVCYNPAPMTQETVNYPLGLCDLLIVNETEGKALENSSDVLKGLASRFPSSAILLTMGEEGAYYQKGSERLHQPAQKVQAVDTTAAGDTFIGYFLACLLEGKGVQEALSVATQASALCVTRSGAMDTIPKRGELR